MAPPPQGQTSHPPGQAATEPLESPVPPHNPVRKGVLLALGLALFLAAGLGLRATAMEPAARWAAATVLLMSYCWILEPLPLHLTATLPLLLYPLFGIGSWPALVLQYFDPINFLFLGGMLIAACMEQWLLHRRIALAVIGRIGVTPRRLVLGCLLSTAFISMWISNTAAALIMYPIGMAILGRVGESLGPGNPLHRRFGMALMLGIAYGASIGGLGTKIGTGTNMVFVKHAAKLHIDIDFLTWLKIGLPLMLLTLPLVWLYLTRIAVRLPAGELPGSAQAIRQECAGQMPLSRGEWVAAAAFLLAALLWIFRKDIDLGALRIPGWQNLVSWDWATLLGRPPKDLPAPLAEWFKADFGDPAVAMLIGLALLVAPVSLRPWRPALRFSACKSIGWDLLLLLGGGFAMAYGIQASGLSNWLGEQLKGLHTPAPLITLLLVCAVALILTEVASNTATANILMPILAAGGAGLGLDPATAMMAATLAASFGFMLPAGTPPNAIAYASGMIRVREMARCGLVVDLLGILLTALTAYYLVPWALGR